jgi:ketohexokinase
MSRILCVGIATLDIINHVAEYPAEDSELRALSQSRRMGGNAANTATLLAQLGHTVSWVGNIGPGSEIVERTFEHFGVDARSAVRLTSGSIPTSYVTLSESSGSRSIVHHRDLPEYHADAFRRLDLNAYDWVHFEGRAIAELHDMLDVVARHPSLSTSLEVEKPREGIEALFHKADVLLFSYVYAMSRGFEDANSLLNSLPAGSLATCSWGAQGAWAIDEQPSILYEPALHLDRIVDTLGAGDVFNAGLISALSRGQPLESALAGAVALASSKCTHEGVPLTQGGSASW